MPKPLTLEAAKARDGQILAKLSEVQAAAQGQKQQTKLKKQKLEWAEQARKLAADARRLDSELEDAALQLGLAAELTEVRAGESVTADVWFQVGGLRKLVAQAPSRMENHPEQAKSLTEVVSSVGSAISSHGTYLVRQVAELERDCAETRCDIRAHLGAEEVWASDRRADENNADLSDDEDAFMEKPWDGGVKYEEALLGLNEQVSADLAGLEQEAVGLRKKRAGWDDDAHYRFRCIQRQFHGRGRDLMLDRLCLEFPHLQREQILAHEEVVDALRFLGQRQAAAFRQWRRARQQLLRQHQGYFDDWQRASEQLSVRRQDMSQQKEKQKVLRERLGAERAKAQVKREERQRVEGAEQRRQQALEADREEQKLRRAKEVKELREKYEDLKREKQKDAAQQAAEYERQEAEENARRQERNSERVKLRREMDEIKAKEMQQQRQRAEQEFAEQQARLQRAMERLKVEAPRDPARLLRRPSRVNVEAYTDPLVCVTRVPAAQQHLLEDKLMHDARYKLSSALQAAGLFSTRAGQEALAAVAAPKPALPHMVSRVFEGYPH